MTPVSHSDVVSQNDILVQVKLMPHRSLGKVGFKRLMWLLAILVGVACLRFYAVGAWPVVLFLAVDIWAVWFAFALNYRRGRAHELVTLTKKELIVEKVAPSGERKRQTLEPYWSRFELTKLEDDDNQLIVRCKDQHILLGDFLPPIERQSVLEELKSNLQRWRAGTLKPAGA